jgi:hypothetical protein
VVILAFLSVQDRGHLLAAGEDPAQGLTTAG